MASWPTEAAGLRRILLVIIAVELAYAVFLAVTWLGSGDEAAGVAALIDGVSAIACGSVWRMARRGRVSQAVWVLTLAIIGVTLPLAAVPPSDPGLAMLPLLGAAIALQYVRGTSLRALLVASWLATVAAAIVVEVVPTSGPLPDWYYPGIRITSFAALAGITLILLAQFAARLRASVSLAQSALVQAEDSALALQRSEVHYRTLVDQAPVAIIVVDADQRVASINPATERLLRRPQDEIVGRPISDFVEPQDLAGQAIRVGRLAPGETLRSERLLVDAAGDTFTVAVIATALAEGGYQLIAEDITERTRVEMERARLAQAVAQAADPVVITDARASITYVNPAFIRASGYSLAEAIGANPRILKSGVQGPEFYAAMWAELRAGRPWSGELMNRRKDGTLYREQATISPIRDSDGVIVSFVALQRGITPQTEMADDLALQARVRVALATALRQVRVEGSLEQAAQAMCDELVTLLMVAIAGIEAYLDGAEVEVVGLTAPGGFPMRSGDRLPPDIARGQRARAETGPWAAYVGDPDLGAAFNEQLQAAGVKALAFGPLVHGDHVDGGLLIGTLDAGFARTLVEKRPAIASFSTATSGLLADRLHARRDEANLRAKVASLIAAGAFEPVFQPIVDLASRDVVGYEALTRFADGGRPDRWFADAWAVGLGEELELATLRSAIADAIRLPGGRWLNVNVAPRLVGESSQLRDVLDAADRPLVLEITEHELVADYARLREAVRALGGDVRLAVDDAGAGAANFAHIVELRPDFVKLDIGLVRGVNTDLGRQALVVAMHHFARTTGCRLVAEGIESEAEACALLELKVEFGQGFWLGRPAPIEAFSSQRAERSEAAG